MLQTDLQYFHAEERSADATNGGKITADLITTGVMNNVWPNVSKAQRDAGHILHRKIFFKVNDDDDGTLTAPQAFIDLITSGGDRIIAFAATDTDTQADITGSERKYGAAPISDDLAAASGPVTFDVTVEDVSLATGTDAIFKVDDKIRLTDKVNPSSVSGNEEILTLTTVTNVDTTVTLTVSEDVANSYLVATNTRVMSLHEPGDIATDVTGFTVTSTAGTYDDTTYPVVADNIGTYADAVTLTFTSATAFTATSANGYTYGSGTISGDFAPNNPDNSKPYFTLNYLGFGGTYVADDKIEFTLVPAYIAHWFKRIVPAGTGSLAGNYVRSAVIGESV